MADVLLANGFCILVLSVLLVGINLQKENRDLSAKRCSGLMVAAIHFFALNILGEVLEGHPEWTALCFTANLLDFLAVDLLVIAFAGYLSVLLGETHTGKAIRSVVIACCARMAIIVGLTAAGKMFAIENGAYVERELSWVPYIVSAMIVVWMLGIVLKYRKRFSVLQLIVIVLYLVLPIPAVVIEMSVNLYIITPMALTLSILLIYVLIQAVTIQQGKVRESVLEELSATDLLTGLPNRRAFYQALAQIEPNGLLGVIFCDMNRLKYTNDHFGHAAGDERIVHFSDVLKGVFDKQEIFRISGDEFVVLCQKISEQTLEDRKNALQKAIHDSDDIAAMGVAFGTGTCSERLISDAEEAMYTQKRAMHAQRESK